MGGAGSAYGLSMMPKYGFPLRGGNAYLVLARSTQQGGLSTPFGWRLTALKMTENQNCERSVRLAPHCAQNDRELKFFRAAFRIGVTAGRCPSPRERAAFPLLRTSAPAS